jgi:hypothetical protein
VDKSQECWHRATSEYEYATYFYNLLGQITASNNVQGSVVFTNTYNPAAELTQIYSSYLSPTQAGDVVSGIVYNAAGQPTSDLLGNGIQEAWTYDAANNQGSYSAGTAYNNSTVWVGNQLAIGATDSVNGKWQTLRRRELKEIPHS